MYECRSESSECKNTFYTKEVNMPFYERELIIQELI